MTLPSDPPPLSQPPPPPAPTGGRASLFFVLGLVALLAVLVARVFIVGGTVPDDGAAQTATSEADDGLVDRERSIKSEQVFSAERMGAELRLLRDEVVPNEKVRNLTILLDGNMAVYTSVGSQDYWIEADGDYVDRKRVRDYPKRYDNDIDLRKVHAITPRKFLMEAEGKFQPRIWKLDALTLAPHPNDPDELMWTASWVDPTPFSLYGDAAGGHVSRTYPPVS